MQCDSHDSLILFVGWHKCTAYKDMKFTTYLENLQKLNLKIHTLNINQWVGFSGSGTRGSFVLIQSSVIKIPDYVLVVYGR
jgi:hypothetical protein